MIITPADVGRFAVDRTGEGIWFIQGWDYLERHGQPVVVGRNITFDSDWENPWADDPDYHYPNGVHLYSGKHSDFDLVRFCNEKKYPRKEVKPTESNVKLAYLILMQADVPIELLGPSMDWCRDAGYSLEESSNEQSQTIIKQ